MSAPRGSRGRLRRSPLLFDVTSAKEASMWRSIRWMVVVIFVAGLVSGGVGMAQDKPGTPPGASGMAPGKAATDKVGTAAGKATKAAGPIDLNTADAATLQSLK